MIFHLARVYNSDTVSLMNRAGGIMTLRGLVIISGIFALVTVGCGKKQSEPRPETVTPPSMAGQKDTTDVFEEFYSDTKEPEKKVSPTFSMNEPASASPAFKNSGAYVVQVATMVSRWLADELATELKEKGYPAYVSEVQNPREDLQGTYYRVRIGTFASIAEARAFGENVLNPAKYNFWVDRKSNDNAPSGSRRTPVSYSPTSAPATIPVSAPVSTPAPAAASTPVPVPQSGESASGNNWNDNSSTW
jgi:hypothetical protein